jgi:hypothetical protein
MEWLLLAAGLFCWWRIGVDLQKIDERMKQGFADLNDDISDIKADVSEISDRVVGDSSLE